MDTTLFDGEHIRIIDTMAGHLRIVRKTSGAALGWVSTQYGHKLNRVTTDELIELSTYLQAVSPVQPSGDTASLNGTAYTGMAGH